MDEKLNPEHGGFRDLTAYQISEIVHDATVAFTRLYVSRYFRTVDQRIQAARSGKQNIAEGSMASDTSKKTELKLVGVACASLEELLLDYTDFFRQNGHEQWPKDHEEAVFIRKLACRSSNSYKTYSSYIETKGPVNAADVMVCVIHQTNFVLDRLLRQLEQAFKEDGGFTERLYRVRSASRRGT